MKADLKQAAAVLGAWGGRSRSPKKQAAARVNGKKGGRPKSLTLQQQVRRDEAKIMRQRIELEKAGL